MQKAQEQKTFSFELFPARSAEARGKLELTCKRLSALKPDYFSVTFGAGGSTRELTLETVLAVAEATGVDSAPHLSCIGYPLEKIRAVLQGYLAQGIRRVVALRGDMPSGTTGVGELRYANELVEFIRSETGSAFHIEVAAYPEFHPQSNSAAADLNNFKRKVEAGADSAITQYFYNPDAYFRFLDSCHKLDIDIPIVPGIMPIINYTQLSRFSEMCGAEIPRWIVSRLRDFGDDRIAIRAFGIDVTTELCRRLLDQGVPGLHFYTMNQYEASEAIWQNLGIETSHSESRRGETTEN
ncbi:MAG: methylenetetrahydrofolate reductase [NAD(P)H] [Proteobacteria bacterium]|nr:MAG: methylenetetrahydrofolate reductase [NAD(P)H] [Pseudomonadota bacterium]